MYAWIGKKRKGVQISEDELTSCVFGPLRTMQPKQAWHTCLVLLGLEDWSPCPEPSRVDVRFWSKFARDDGHRRYVEPDVHIIAWVDNKLVATILVEVKWGALLGENQLLDQWKWISVDGQRREDVRECSRHILLSDGGIEYAEEIERQRKSQSKHTKWADRLVHVSWHDVAWNLKSRKHRLVEVETWRSDLLRFLTSQGIVAFEGFRHLRLAATGPVEWRFDGSIRYSKPEIEPTGALEWAFQEEGAPA